MSHFETYDALRERYDGDTPSFIDLLVHTFGPQETAEYLKHLAEQNILKIVDEMQSQLKDADDHGE